VHLATITNIACNLSYNDFPGSQIRLIPISATSLGLRRRENGSNLGRSDAYRFFFDGTSHLCTLFRQTVPKLVKYPSFARQHSTPRNHPTRQKRQFLNFFFCPGAAAPIPLGWWQPVALATFEPYNSGGFRPLASLGPPALQPFGFLADLVNLAAHPSASSSRSRPGTSAPFPIRLRLGSCAVSRAVQQHTTLSPGPVNTPLANPTRQTGGGRGTRLGAPPWRKPQPDPSPEPEPGSGWPKSKIRASTGPGPLPRRKTSRACLPHASCERS
jgi:hypothetical protein